MPINIKEISPTNMNERWMVNQKAGARPLGLVTGAPEGDEETVIEGLRLVHQINDLRRFVNAGDRAVLREKAILGIGKVNTPTRH